MARYFTNGEGKCRDETGMFQNQSSKRCACKDHWKHTESFQHTGSFMMRNKPLLRVSILQPALASTSNKSSVKFLKTNTHFRSLKPHELGIQKQPKTYLLLIRDSIAFYKRIQRLRIGIVVPEITHYKQTQILPAIILNSIVQIYLVSLINK